MKSCLHVPSRWNALSEWKNRWHTWTCPDCRRARQADRVVLRAARALRRPALNPALETKILARMGLGEGSARCPAPRARFAHAAPRVWLASATAAALLAFLAGLFGHQPSRQQARPMRIAALGVPAFLHENAKERKREITTGIRHFDGMNRTARNTGARTRPGPVDAQSISPDDPGRPVHPVNPVKMPVLRDLRPSVPSVPLRTRPFRAFALSRFRAKMPGARDRQDDLAYVNRSLEASLRRWAPLSRDEWERLEWRVRRHARLKDDFITIPFPRIAAASDRQIAAAAESYKREAAVVDPRLAHEVTCASKATALADFCGQLRADTGVQLSAGPSVGDEKVTVFCEKLPLREVMRQLSRTFGYTWLRSKREGGDYRYELIQDLKSQLLEEELRNRDRNAALLALDRDMGRYSPYLTLSPDEALARSKTAGEGDKKLLEKLAGAGWGPIQMYFRLSPQDQAALRAGQELKFKAEPGTGERQLPADIARGVLQARRDVHVVRDSNEKGGYRFGGDQPDAVPPTAVPEARAGVTLKLEQTELGRFGFSGSSEVSIAGSTSGEDNGPYATGLSPSVTEPDNASLNARLAADPALKGKVTVGDLGLPAKSRAPEGSESLSDQSKIQNPKSKITTADLLEALHHATGMPIVADFYTRLYPADTVMVKDRPLFDALNRLADAMRLRWSKDEDAGAPSTRDAGTRPWLQFRSASFYNDRLKEVPNRLLSRWAAARREHGSLLLDDLVEIAGLSDAQLDAVSMADGARELWGLEEWDMACNRAQRPHLRWMATLTPAQREAIQKPPGLRFTTLTLAQQQQFIALAVGDSPDSVGSLAELATATVQVDYPRPGAFEWQPAEKPEKKDTGPEPFVPVRAPTREAALVAARRIDPQADLSQIQPTRLALMLLYQWGTPQAHGSLRIHTTGRGDTSIGRNRSKNSP